MRAALPVLALLTACVGSETTRIVVVGPEGVTEVTPCATGCAAPTADETDHLGDVEVTRLLEQVAAAPLGAPELALETLLFHGAETGEYLARHGVDALPPAHAQWLLHELDRDQVDIGFRLLDDDGTVLGWRDDVVPLKEKQHLLLHDMGALGRADINGKVKRVGVEHLWARF